MSGNCGMKFTNGTSKTKEDNLKKSKWKGLFK